MSLLTIVQAACGRIGITQPVSVSGSSDPQIVQLMGLTNEDGQELAARYPWSVLISESTFTTVATQSQGAMTTICGIDFRYILNETMWNRSILQPIYGALSPQDWQNLKARNVTGPWTQYRIRGTDLLFVPTPSAGQTVAFEWVSKHWVLPDAGGTAATMRADADISNLDERIITQGVIWRWKAAKGLEYAEDYNKYERLVADQSARDGGKARLNLAGVGGDYPFGTIVPIGSWSL